jgi:hypothetical protein
MLMSLSRLWNRLGKRKTLPIRTRTTPPRKRPRTLLNLEALEDRLVPTISFTPQFLPTETSSASANASSLHSPPVVLIFTGNYWQQTTQGQQDEENIIYAVQNIVSSPYLGKLTQYGYQGNATFNGYGSTHNDTVYTPTLDGPNGNTPSGKTLVNFVNGEITLNPSWALATSGDSQQQPIYVVINDPQDSSTSPGTYGFNQASGSTHAIYVGATASSPGGHVNLDQFTQVFSHELAESIAPAITVSDPGAFNAGNQIADNEPEAGAGYTFRLNTGELVQAYWSQSDNAFVVPDGNKQTFNLQPIWSGNKFTGQYNLNVYGDQLGSNYNDQIYIDKSAFWRQYGGVQVGLNGESATFDPGIIKAINVNTYGGSNQVNVNAVPFGVTLSVGSWGQSNDTVTVGSNGSLANIAGTVNVANQSGKTQLIVEDSNDTTGRSFVVTNNAVASSGMPGLVNYTGAATNYYGVMAGVTSLVVDGGSGSNTFTVSSTAANTPVTLNTGPLFGSSNSNTVYIDGSSSAVSVQSYGRDYVDIGYHSGSLASIGGPVNVSNVSGQDQLLIDDLNDPNARSIDITNTAVQFAAAGSEPAVTINYKPAQQNSNGQMVGVNYLQIWDAAAANRVEVDSVGSNTSTGIYGDTRDTLTGAASGQVYFVRWRT